MKGRYTCPECGNRISWGKGHEYGCPEMPDEDEMEALQAAKDEYWDRKIDEAQERKDAGSIDDRSAP